LVPTLLNDMPPEWAARVFLHPIHRDAFRDSVELIADLRKCQTYRDYYQFQQKLLGKVLEIQEHRGACRRMAKRLRKGKAVPAGSPDLRSGEDLDDPGSWELEADVCERVDRQLRSIGDALAWRVFSYDRKVIIAFSRNQAPGPMAGKAGLSAERDFVERWSEDEDSFVLMHDLTSCLRIGDATLFKSVGKGYEAYLYEIKSDPNHKRPDQLRRNKLAEEAVRDNGPFPHDPDARFVQLDTPYKTHLPMLRDAFDLAQRRGTQGMKVPDGRALMAADMRRGYELWPEEEFIARSERAFEDACKRAGIVDRTQFVGSRSDDRVARAPTHPPWAIYPFPPAVCANLIFDMAFYAAGISGASLRDALRKAGLATDWMLPTDQEQIQPGQVMMRVYHGNRGLELREAEIARLTLELVDLPTWVEGLKEMLAQPDLSGRPWPCFADEHRVWA
jgi:hypothetical protein